MQIICCFGKTVCLVYQGKLRSYKQQPAKGHCRLCVSGMCVAKFLIRLIPRLRPCFALSSVSLQTVGESGSDASEMD